MGRWGGGVGTGKGTGKSMRMRLSKLPFSTLPFTSKTQTSLNKEVRLFSLGDNSIWSCPSVSSLSGYSIWRS